MQQKTGMPTACDMHDSTRLDSTSGLCTMHTNICNNTILNTNSSPAFSSFVSVSEYFVVWECRWCVHIYNRHATTIHKIGKRIWMHIRREAVWPKTLQHYHTQMLNAKQSFNCFSAWARIQFDGNLFINRIWDFHRYNSHQIFVYRTLWPTNMFGSRMHYNFACVRITSGVSTWSHV